jgi:hypothetical protein
MNNETLNYAIYYLADTGVSEKIIAKKLGTTTKVVKASLSNRPIEKNTNIKTTSGKMTSKDMMIRQTSAKGIKSVAIMTKEASQVNDEFKKNIKSKASSKTAKDSIYRPN